MEDASVLVNELASDIKGCNESSNVIKIILTKVCRLYKAHGGICLLINYDRTLYKSVCSIGIGKDLGHIVLGINEDDISDVDNYNELNERLMTKYSDKVCETCWLPLKNVYNHLIGAIVITYLYRTDGINTENFENMEGFLSYISALIDNVRLNKYFHNQLTKVKKVEKIMSENDNQVRQTLKMEALGTLAGGIAHDFNNILTGIVGYTELSLEDAPRDSMMYQCLIESLKLSERAKDLVAQILSFSRKNANLYQRLDLVKILSETIKMLRATFPSNIKIEENYRCSSVVMYDDPTEFQQLIMNLCINGEQAMQENGGTLSVTLDTIENETDEEMYDKRLNPGKYVKISIRDSGCGIDKQTLERIFEPFFTTKGAKEGTGLGLSVVHGIVNRHKGVINVESEPGKGSVFDVFLPV